MLSLSPGPALIEQAWHYETYANMWRITDDFWDQWDLLRNMFDRCELWQAHVAQGSYPDCDMLPVGKLGKGFGKEWDTRFSKEEQITMMTLWCVFGSPLMIGTELTLLDAWTLRLLTRKEVLKLTQSSYAGRQVEKDDTHAVWSCLHAENGEAYVAFFNFEERQKEIACCLTEVEQFADMCGEWENLRVKELWTEQEIQLDGVFLKDAVAAHGARLYRIG